MVAKLTKDLEHSWSFVVLQAAGDWQKLGLVDEL